MKLREHMTARWGLIALAALAVIGLGLIGAAAAWRATLQPEAYEAAEEPCNCKAGIRARALQSRRVESTPDLP